MSQTRRKRVARKHQKSPLTLVLLAGGGLLLMLLAFFALRRPASPQAPAEGNGAPRLKVDQEKVDLGDVKLGQTVQVTFQITNIGDQTLRFSKEPYIEVKAGC